MCRTLQRSDPLPLADALGSVRGVTDSSGTLAVTTSYDAFGAVRSQSGASLALGYTGEQTDPATGFVNLRARELDPTLGRFLSADTVQPNAPGSQGYNLYAYVANNPTTWVDPSGHYAFAGTVELIDGSSTDVTGPMVAAAAMRIAYRSAAVLTEAISAVRSVTIGSALLAFTVGVVVCFLDLRSSRWIQATYMAGLFLHYGSAAVARMPEHLLEDTYLGRLL